MRLSLVIRQFALLAAAGMFAVACSEDSTEPGLKPDESCSGIQVDPTPGATTPRTLSVLGVGLDTMRYTAEIAVRGSIAYTTTWGTRRAVGNAINVWDVSGACPQKIDSVIVPAALTTGDVAVSDDGKLLVVATEFSGGSIVVYDLTDPRHPAQLSRFSNDQTSHGVHTAELGRVNGKLYAFLSVDPAGNDIPARLVIVDLSTPSSPQQVYVKETGKPYVHDTFARDGLLFVALWNDGMEIWDIGGGAHGGTPSQPVILGSVKTIGGDAHNVWWYHDPSGSKRFAFVGEEGPGSVGSTSRGDIHVIDVADLTAPKEVGVFHVESAGTHNFSVDEPNGVLYAAYYNGGVRAIDIRGDLSACAANQRLVDGPTGLSRCDLRAMGREIGVGLVELGRPVYVWGVQYVGGNIFASDMINGIWKLGGAK